MLLLLLLLVQSQEKECKVVSYKNECKYFHFSNSTNDLESDLNEKRFSCLRNSSILPLPSCLLAGSVQMKCKKDANSIYIESRA